MYNKAMKEEKTSYLEIKKSKFYAYYYKINSIDEIDKIIDHLWKENKKARHIVYAYKYGNIEKNYADKEPNGTTRGLIDIIHHKELDNTLIVVVRYFGGILLGSGHLTRAYTKVVSDMFNN